MRARPQNIAVAALERVASTTTSSGRSSSRRRTKALIGCSARHAASAARPVSGRSSTKATLKSTSPKAPKPGRLGKLHPKTRATMGPTTLTAAVTPAAQSIGSTTRLGKA
jgi:hypothetical protein